MIHQPDSDPNAPQCSRPGGPQDEEASHNRDETSSNKASDRPVRATDPPLPRATGAFTGQDAAWGSAGWRTEWKQRGASRGDSGQVGAGQCQSQPRVRSSGSRGSTLLLREPAGGAPPPHLLSLLDLGPLLGAAQGASVTVPSSSSCRDREALRLYWEGVQKHLPPSRVSCSSLQSSHLQSPAGSSLFEKSGTNVQLEAMLLKPGFH